MYMQVEKLTSYYLRPNKVKKMFLILRPGQAIRQTDRQTTIKTLGYIKNLTNMHNKSHKLAIVKTDVEKI